jgi:hypothetical protein
MVGFVSDWCRGASIRSAPTMTIRSSSTDVNSACYTTSSAFPKVVPRTDGNYPSCSLRCSIAYRHGGKPSSVNLAAGGKPTRLNGFEKASAVFPRSQTPNLPAAANCPTNFRRPRHQSLRQSRNQANANSGPAGRASAVRCIPGLAGNDYQNIKFPFSQFWQFVSKHTSNDSDFAL